MGKKGGANKLPNSKSASHASISLRIVKNTSKGKHRHKKSVNITRNNLVYKFHFCLHRNLKRGMPKGLVRGIFLSKQKPSLESPPPAKLIIRDTSKLEDGIITGKDKASEIDVLASRVAAKDIALVDGTATPSSVTAITLLEGKKRMRSSLTCKKAIETASKSAIRCRKNSEHI